MTTRRNMSVELKDMHREWLESIMRTHRLSQGQLVGKVGYRDNIRDCINGKRALSDRAAQRVRRVLFGVPAFTSNIPDWNTETFVDLKWDELKVGDYFGPDGMDDNRWAYKVLQKTEEVVLVEHYFSATLWPGREPEEMVFRRYSLKHGYLRRVKRKEAK